MKTPELWASATIAAGDAVRSSYVSCAAGPPDPHTWRDDLTGYCAPLSLTGAQVLASFVQLTDLHVMDASSPARVEACQLLVDDPRWRAFTPTHRPYELLNQHALASMVATIAESPFGPVSGAPFDVAIVTGDCLDNAQRNELDAYLALLDGGVSQLPYDGVQSRDWADVGFWCPDAVDGLWQRDRGFPSYPGLVEAINEPLVSAGLGVGWLAVVGNHDVMRQGTAFSNPALEEIALGDQKADAVPVGFLPDDVLRAYIETPHAFNVGATTRSVRPDSGRRSITSSEFIGAHSSSTVRIDGHGFVPNQGGDYVHDLGEVRVIVVDTNHPAGHYEGSVGRAQLAWLGDRISDARARWVVVASHHGLDSLTNEEGGGDERLLADPVAAVLHEHPNVIAWVSGHRHTNRITARPHPSGAGGGFWDIVTASIIDWPSQSRAVEILRLTDGQIVIATTAIDHHAAVSPGSDALSSVNGLAAIHREVALNTSLLGGVRGPAKLTGRAVDRNALLSVR
jgi:metallophosphoesterase (TIGR03767 family)